MTVIVFINAHGRSTFDSWTIDEKLNSVVSWFSALGDISKLTWLCAESLHVLLARVWRRVWLITLVTDFFGIRARFAHEPLKKTWFPAHFVTFVCTAWCEQLVNQFFPVLIESQTFFQKRLLIPRLVVLGMNYAVGVSWKRGLVVTLIGDWAERELPITIPK